MKRNNFLIKLIVLIVFVSMLLCFMVGCDTPNHDLDGEQGDGNKTNSGVKPIMDALYINYDLPEDYNADDKIVIELFLGTAQSKAYIELIKDYYGDKPQTFEELTTIKVYATIREGTLTNQERSSVFYELSDSILLSELTGFYSDNYPYPKKDIPAKSIFVEIPKSELVGKRGEIFVCTKFFDDYGQFCLKYAIEDGTIIIKE